MEKLLILPIKHFLKCYVHCTGSFIYMQSVEKHRESVQNACAYWKYFA